MAKKLYNQYIVNELRNIGKMNGANDGNRSLIESIVSYEVLQALEDWTKNNDSNCVLIGGLALSYYVKPRATMDVDVLYLLSEDIPNYVEKFKKNRNHAFQHNLTHVEIELITPQLINTPIEIVQKVFDTSTFKDRIKIASPSGIVALKLGRFNLQDQADIAALIDYTTIDLSDFNLSVSDLEKYDKLVEYIKNNK